MPTKKHKHIKFDDIPSKGRNILPPGIWTLEDLGTWLEIPPSILQEVLAEYGIKVMPLSNRYKHKLVRMDDIYQTIGKPRHEVSTKAFPTIPPK